MSSSNGSSSSSGSIDYPDEYKQLAKRVVDDIYYILSGGKKSFVVNYYCLIDALLLSALSTIRAQQERTSRKVSHDEVMEMSSKYMSYIMADLHKRHLAYLSTDEELK